MSKLGEVWVDVRGDADPLVSDIGSGLSQVEGVAQGFGSRLEAALTGPLARGAATAGAAAATAIGAGLTQAGRLDGQMREVVTLFGLSGAAAEASVTSLQVPVRDLSTTLGIAQSNVTDGLYQAISAGVPRDNVFEFLDAAGRFAIGGVTDMSAAVDGLTTATNAWGIDVSQVDKVADAFFAAIRGGKTNAEELSASLFNVAPSASAAGVSLEETLAATAALTASGVPTSVATTQIRQAIEELNDPSREVAEVFEELSGQTFRDFMASGGTMQEALQMLGDNAADSGMQIGELFGSVQASAAATTLYNDASGAFAENLRLQADAAGMAAGAYEVVAAGAAHQFEVLKQQGAALLTTLGQTFLPFVNGVLGGLTRLMGGFMSLSGPTQRFIAGLVGAIAVLGPLPLLLGKMIGPLARAGREFMLFGKMLAGLGKLLLANPIVLGLVAIGAALYLLWTRSETFRNIVTAVWEAVKTAAAAVVDWFMGTAVPWLQNAWERIKVGVQLLWQVMQAVWERIREAAAAAVEWFMANVAPRLQAVWEAIKTAAAAAADWFMTHVWPLFQAFGELFSALWEGASGRFGGVWDTIVGIMSTTWDVLQTIWSAISEAWSVLWAAIQAVWDAVGPPLMTIISAAWEQLKANVELVWTVIRTVIETVLGVIQGIIQTVTAAIRGDWQGVWEGIKAIFTSVWDGIKGVLSAVATWIGSTVRRMVDLVRDLFGRMRDRVVDFVGRMRDRVVDFVGRMRDRVVEFVTGLRDRVVETVGAMRDRAVETVGAMRDRVVEFITNLRDRVVERITDLRDRFVERFTALRDLVLAIATVIRDRVVEFVTGLRDRVVERITNLREQVVQRFQALRDLVLAIAAVVRDRVTQAFNALRDRVTSAVNAARDRVTSAMNAARDRVTSAANAARDRVTQAFNALRDRAAQAVNTARDRVTSAANAARDRAVSAFNGMRDRVVSAVNGLRDRVRSTFDSVVDFVRNIPSRLLSALGNVGSLFEGAGRRLIQGLTRGIRNAFSGARNAVSSGVRGLRNLLPFSPAREGPLSGRGHTLYAGQAFVDDLTKGIRQRSGPLQDAARMMMDDVASELQTPMRLPISDLERVANGVRMPAAAIRESQLSAASRRPVQMHVEIHNPAPEPASASITRVARQLQHTGVFG